MNCRILRGLRIAAAFGYPSLPAPPAVALAAITGMVRYDAGSSDTAARLYRILRRLRKPQPPRTAAVFASLTADVRESLR